MILVPSTGPEAWQALLADPELHWRRGYSARTLASCWEAAGGALPPEVAALFAPSPASEGAAMLRSLEPLMVCPEWRVPLPPGGGRPTQHDVWVLARSGSGLVSIAVEGKVAETFGPTVTQWRTDYTDGKRERIEAIGRLLGLGEPLGALRYQLLHRTAGALVEAQRFGCAAAVMLVHSFSAVHDGWDDFTAFRDRMRARAVGDGLWCAGTETPPHLYLGWASGDRKFLDS